MKCRLGGCKLIHAGMKISLFFVSQTANVAEDAEQEVLNSIDDPSERRRISEMLND